jgi:hypothetical protein
MARPKSASSEYPGEDPMPGRPDLSTHPLVERSHEGPSTPRGVVRLTGYFGPSSKLGMIRLYQGLDFQSYFEIPKDEIVATAPARAEDDQGPTVAYVRMGTLVEAVHSSTRPVESYLRGGITSQHLKAAQRRVDVAAKGEVAGPTVVCAPFQPIEPGHVLAREEPLGMGFDFTYPARTCPPCVG